MKITIDNYQEIFKDNSALNFQKIDNRNQSYSFDFQKSYNKRMKFEDSYIHRSLFEEVQDNICINK